ncbi:protein HAPLESS 2 isoform X1 [Rhododendron vialii]|uniref:protein HAPLESS 2 isoform X1 n=1 Tax=Rhododendron vialii TaxID=182163 RepID=UPI00265E2912|nr:protein HAPLESS 2 isoform X1 [Rhododendron vialii]
MILFIVFSLFLSPHHSVSGTQILSKSKLEKCEKVSDSATLNCSTKIVLNMAVPGESSGGEASIVAEIVEVEENSSTNMRTPRIPPVITVNKTAAYALYQLTYIRDVAYKPEEFYIQTRKCEPDAGADVVQKCERLRDEDGHIVEHTEPTCCPCGDQRRVPSSCGNFFDKMLKGKANTAHCLRFPGDWFHVFGIGQRSVGFSIRIEVKTESKLTDVIVDPENRTVTSNDNFLRANLVGDYVGYTSIPSFEEHYLVIPRQGGPGQPQNLGMNFSMWMLLERVRFTLDGLECNKMGVGYEAFNGQPDFCSSPFWSCLHNQLWNFWEADMNRISRNQSPLYVIQGRFERINQHPNPGSHSFSIGISEVLNTNLLVELSADDIEYVYQRSPGKILSITVQTFEALTQFGTATITSKNIGEVEASYSLTFDCSTGVSQMEEQFYIMKPKEVTNRSFKLYLTTDQAAKYMCAAILKDSGFSEVDRAECQFTTTATIIDNGSQIPFQPPKTSINGFFESIESLWRNFWNGLADFITGKTCRKKCSGFFDFSCHIQYICMSWIVMFGLLLAIFPAVVVLLWLLHQKGLFDPLYDWWEDHVWADEQRHGDTWKHGFDAEVSGIHVKKHHKQEGRHHKHDTQKKRRSVHNENRHNHSERDTDYHYYLHHVHKDKHKHGRTKGTSIMQQIYLDKGQDGHVGHRRRRKEREAIDGLSKVARYSDENPQGHHRNKHELFEERHSKLNAKQRE